MKIKSMDSGTGNEEAKYKNVQTRVLFVFVVNKDKRNIVFISHKLVMNTDCKEAKKRK